MAKIISGNDFQKEVLEASVPVLVDFYADWCGPCKALGPTINELSSEYEGKAKIVKVNVDESNEIAANYGIQSIPTLILFKNGEAVKTLVGMQPKPALAQTIEDNL